MGTAGVVMNSTVFVQLGLPMEAVALLVAIDALVGMGCTVLNVTGDLTGSSVMNQTEKNKAVALCSKHGDDSKPVKKSINFVAMAALVVRLI
ncbi:cation:dicarboxylate symporter family transporter [Evansella vedderi]|uniref:cation:dicarboxylate symporter family transporter n=1 Tax=Evansella vedderi TaxID=38282 RepID=UPI003522307F